MRICPKCSSENADTALFCISCGSSMRNAETIKIPVKKIEKQYKENEPLKTEELFDDEEEAFDDFDEFEEDDEFELQLRRYMLEQGPLEKGKDRKGKKEDKKIVLVGVISILAVLVGGILAFNLLSGAFTGRSSRTTTARLSDDMIKELTREKEPEADLYTQDQEKESEKTEEAPAEQAPKPKVSASLMTAADLDNTGYERVTIVDAKASSIIEQEGFDNTPIRATDGNENTSWQEGVDGPGIGETVEYTFDRVYNIHSMTFKLGNWASENYFWMNNRPETMTIWLDDVGFEVTFPDGMTEYALLFAEDIAVSEVSFEINSVYKGNTYDDTCLTDIGIYGV